MKMIDNRKKNLVCFKNLNRGDVFIFNNETYMKTFLVENNIRRYNIICLTTGNMTYIDYDTIVELIINCELVLKG